MLRMDTELASLLDSELNSNEQQIFLQNFKHFLDHDSENDHVIDLEFAFKWLGFARKDVGKRLLEKYFIINKDYIETVEKLSLHKNLERSLLNNKGGQNKEIIMMTPNTFKELCIQANTEKGKEVRKYYIKMEAIVNKYLKEKNEKLSKEHQNNIDKINQLQNEMMALQKLVKPRKKYELGDTVYIFRHVTDQDIYKVGSSENMNTRDDNYFCHNVTGDIVYTKKCNNKKLLEDVVHHILQNYTINNRKDWFEIKYEIIKEIVDSANEFLDKMIILCSDTINNKNLISTFKDQIPQKLNISNLEILPKKITKEPVEEFIKYQEIEKPIAEIPNVPEEEMFHIDKNFDKFFQECFKINKDKASSLIEITARYRLWSRSKKDFKDSLVEYFNNKNLKEVLIYDPITKCNLTCHKGLELIPLPTFILTNKSSETEKFLFENCINSITGRISSKELFETYFNWKNKNDPSYIKLTNDDKKQVNLYLNKNYFGTTVYTGERIRFGFYGLCLKNKESESVGTKQKPKNRKVIQQLNMNNEIIHEYVSITQAAYENTISISRMSVIISNSQVHKGFTFKIKE
jgi:phage anti-repressor protein